MNLPRTPTPTIKIWGATAEGCALAHPMTGRSPGDRKDGMSMPNDAFTCRRIVDGDWTDQAPAPAKPAPAPAAKPAPSPAPADKADK